MSRPRTGMMAILAAMEGSQSPELPREAEGPGDETALTEAELARMAALEGDEGGDDGD